MQGHPAVSSPASKSSYHAVTRPDLSQEGAGLSPQAFSNSRPAETDTATCCFLQARGCVIDPVSFANRTCKRSSAGPCWCPPTAHLLEFVYELQLKRSCFIEPRGSLRPQIRSKMKVRVYFRLNIDFEACAEMWAGNTCAANGLWFLLF